ncbi:MAG: hypothetical protein ACK41T_08235 [Pseudobdellovibrio sp.]
MRFDLGYYKILVFSLIFFFIGYVNAESLKASGATSAAVTVSSTPIVSSVSEGSLTDDLIQGNRDIAEWFDDITEGLDIFLVGKRITEEKNKSSFRIDNTTTSSEGENLKNSTSLGVNVRLRNVEEYFHLKFTSYDEDEQGHGVENSYLRKTQRTKNYGATVGFFRTLGNIKTKFQPRIELKNPINISHSLSFESMAKVQDLQVNPKTEFFASAANGVGMFQAINLNYELTKKEAITFINEAEYQEKIAQLSVTNGIVLSQVVTQKSFLSYSWLLKSLSRESYHLDNQSISVTWGETVYKNILEYQLTPYISFDKSHRFKGLVGVVFNIGIIF